MEFDSIKWDEPVYTLKEFIKAFELPQIVCVRDGYFDIKEITTLSTHQVMTLHNVKKCRMLKGLSELKQDEQLSIPVNTQGAIELLSDKLPKKSKMYKSIKAAKNDSAKMVDIIDVESHCNFPCTVKIHGHSMTKDNVDERSQSLDLSTLGRIKLLGAYDYVKLIASIHHMGKVSVMQVPIDLEITVAAAKGAQQKESSYQSLCKEIHDNTQFQQLDGVDQLDYVKMGNDEDSVDNIYDYIDLRYLELPPSPERTTSTKPLPVRPKPRTTSIRTTTTKPPPVLPKPRTTSMESETPSLQSSSSSPTHSQTDRLGFNIPESLEKLSVEEVANCLRYLHMEAYVEKFQAELIDGAMLVELNEEMLRDSLGVTNKLHQKKLMMLVNGWRPT
ncbi:hypothetical protein QZH41_006333 [Actinostola sp. cb2023]|nr:hypothetical protein QZH41_006333 [Actinostola sp. cb2023]